jgi:TDG/mug DNA glycosylase family protein
MAEKLVSFPPVIPAEPKALILGSMPGGISLEKQEYYGNPRNHFWPILFELFGQDPLEDYEEKLTFAKRNGIALWDTIGSCLREGSLDANIKEVEPNDIRTLLLDHPGIRLIGCNGTKSYQLFRRHIHVDDLQVKVTKLPSTSPIPGRYTKNFAGKVEAWKVIKHWLDSVS